MQRPVRAAPNVQRRGRAQRRVQIDLRPFDRRPRRVAGREARRDGRAEGAARAVRVPRGDGGACAEIIWGARRSSLTPGGTREGRDGAVREGAHVDDDVVARSPRRPDPRHRRGLVLAQARALDHDGARPVLEEPRRERPRAVHRERSLDRFAAQQLRLGRVRRDHGRERQQLGLDRFDRRVVDEDVAGRRAHHRVDDHAADVRRAKPPRDRLDDVHGSEQARLHGVHREVVEDGVHLLHDERGRQPVHAVHADRVLRRDRRHRVRAEHAQGLAGLDLRLQARAAAAVAARDEQHSWRAQRGGAARDQQQHET